MPHRSNPAPRMKVLRFATVLRDHPSCGGADLVFADERYAVDAAAEDFEGLPADAAFHASCDRDDARQLRDGFSACE